MARIGEDDTSEFIFGCLILLVVGGLIVAMIASIYPGTDNSKRIAEISSRSDSYVVLTSGKYANTYYTTRTTILVTEHGSCIAFTDNSTNTPISACTQFIIKAN